MLLGVPQINEPDIKLDTHRRQRRLPLESYDPTVDFQADTRLQCFLSEKDLVTWAAHHHDVPVGTVTYSHLDVIYCEKLKPEEIAQLRAVSEKYQIVFIANKGGLPALANHPLSPSTSKTVGNTCPYLYPNGARVPSLFSAAGHRRCWIAVYMSNQSHLPPPDLTSSGKTRPTHPKM